MPPHRLNRPPCRCGNIHRHLAENKLVTTLGREARINPWVSWGQNGFCSRYNTIITSGRENANRLAVESGGESGKIQKAVAIFRIWGYAMCRLMPLALTVGISRPLTETVMSGHISALSETVISECFATRSANLTVGRIFRPIFTREESSCAL